ncbi:hypothetical protein EWB00_001358 [Schistosoma japonicum]|uniref:Uncharacterized protein n=1 Tax=Schistosoma japonicum TaxID=6182 RepID=A0A4Z2CK20_SCHJA|nr:hypothetical protein EWB00_001358 [Schistosoma japonicum]
MLKLRSDPAHRHRGERQSAITSPSAPEATAASTALAQRAFEQRLRTWGRHEEANRDSLYHSPSQLQKARIVATTGQAPPQGCLAE